MDESVIFIKEIREGDSDIYVIDDDYDISNNDQRVSSKDMQSNKNSNPVAYIDLSRDSIGSVLNDSQIPTKKENAVTFECSVCLESLQNLELKVLQCGHLFCTKCVDKLILMCQPKCPKCRKIIVKRNIRPVYV